ncbi:ABC transporter substrate-binding protein [Haloferax sp. MBLA0076]|uniref:ABC transporter substrate-binding protein n=1 Tax=Haloferax litoreum TaxID=2666140 RepID=A0A6A8GCE8_9EURY|nr:MULTISPECIES: thiamine pyrophosphate-dependent dehydrogenase E1 component subunit alpha [Haloferax]KAB1192277.1 thiamine pyrophosphate-dependent dehydrogenase E1 component subunit alpha [Haloferax sp. CBA1148]MRX20735.1 ABC transporter substrate-binding protein [Haloferax litoreum]
MVVIDIETEDGQREALRRMLTIRAFDTKAGELFADGELPGFVHLYVGEEAVGVGACSALEENDYITSTHRGHGHCIAKGLDPKQMMSELYGKADGYCNGKGGSMHIADVDAGMLGANGIVGAGPPLATGAALTAQLKGEDKVALAFFGDGAVAQGQVHEAINIAATWDLPAVFVVENNQYGEGTPVEKQHNVQNLSETAEAYNIPGFTVDGMDITAVYEAVKEARKRAADGQGPTFIEAETYRYHGHFEGDQQPYRTEEDIDIWKDRDAIESFKQRLVDAGTITEAEFDEMKAEIDEQIETAVEEAKSAPYPDPSEAYEDMFNATVPEISQFSSQMRADGGEDR